MTDINMPVSGNGTDWTYGGEATQMLGQMGEFAVTHMLQPAVGMLAGGLVSYFATSIKATAVAKEVETQIGGLTKEKESLERRMQPTMVKAVVSIQQRRGRALNIRKLTVVEAFFRKNAAHSKALVGAHKVLKSEDRWAAKISNMHPVAQLFMWILYAALGLATGTAMFFLDKGHAATDVQAEKRILDDAAKAVDVKIAEAKEIVTKAGELVISTADDSEDKVKVQADLEKAKLALGTLEASKVKADEAVVAFAKVAAFKEAGKEKTEARAKASTPKAIADNEVVIKEAYDTAAVMYGNAIKANEAKEAADLAASAASID